MNAPSKVPMPQAPMVDLGTGYATRPWNNFFNNLVGNANAGAAGTITAEPGSGLAIIGVSIADGLSILISPNGVTNAMIRQSAAYSVIGRAFGTTGNVADISASANDRVLARIGNVLAFFDVGLVPVVTPPVAVADLPAAPATGTRSMVNDALAPAFGVAVANGGAAVVPVYYDGAAWLVG